VVTIGDPEAHSDVEDQVSEQEEPKPKKVKKRVRIAEEPLSEETAE